MDTVPESPSHFTSQAQARLVNASRQKQSAQSSPAPGAPESQGKPHSTAEPPDRPSLLLCTLASFTTYNWQRALWENT